MQRSSGSQARPALLKRKRRSSDNFSNIENVPVREDKRHKEERLCSEDGNSSADERLPLSELSVLRVASCKERQDNSCRTELVVAEERSPGLESDILEGVFHVDLSPSALLSLSAEQILAEKPVEPSHNPTSPTNRSKYFGQRQCPLPVLDWVDTNVLWEHFLKKDKESELLRSSKLFERHPNLQPRMRAVLLEWIIEVCDVYKLHRETYYLAMDYLDRYLSLTKTIPKGQLQLIGITCLLIASKVEEIYPPKVSEFAYVTDGACTDEEIIKMELVIVKTLNWKCTVITPNSWLCIYMQVCYQGHARNNMEMIFPQYPTKLFSLMAQLLDLVTLDEGTLRYSYGVVAAACIYVVCSKFHALNASGFELADIKDCVNWVGAFWEALQEERNLEVPNTNNKQLPPPPNKHSSIDFTHTLQSHNVSLELLEAGQAVFHLRSDQTELQNLNILTPPSSSKKH